MSFSHPTPYDDLIYLTEGGFETELLYLHGIDLPCFAALAILSDPAERAIFRGIYERVCDVAAAEKTGLLLGWIGYRASLDWGAKLGLSQDGLKEATLVGIDFLKELRKSYIGQVPDFRINEGLGPRGDAYSTGGAITEAEAEDYHSVQIETVKGKVDLVWAATQKNIPEVIGMARAAKALGQPLAVSWSLNSESRRNSGPTLEEAVTQVDAAVPGGVAWHSINCSHPLEFEPALAPGTWLERLRCIRPNAAAMDKIALCKLGHIEDGDPVELGRQMGGVAERFPWMDIWGGCCGTDHRHLAEIARNVKAVRKAAFERSPDLEEAAAAGNATG
ncbi:homocysteine S-methyltransferase family protein [Marimonas lutisalis]|uniref:homocysteine S-methyltransferase family protein n=1 Tax=Marimonas lutisalis TaxID=2545756 RepID=UPI0010F7DBE5|nr:homocysteine S-methyltransferase family protein [Marimonas lutisalis]